eukprot:TRINITY_DN5005_c0_g1_i16.p1 TRINITY_DN5005_c0_g1~~TRINITY_DN5005_c0_g1_i16.p1  ORF type:complete len:292 (+),score=47.92 TRINITY_DN5005_c0_g1_i16:979-1854(+)
MTDANILLNVWDKDFFTRDFMGCVTIILSKHAKRATHDLWFDLSSRPQRNDVVTGRIHLRFDYVTLNSAKDTLHYEMQEIADVHREISRMTRPILSQSYLAAINQKLPVVIDTANMGQAQSNSLFPPLNAGKLTITISEGRCLRAMDIGGLSDPYCEISLRNDSSMTYFTKVIEKTLNPVWNETFEILVLKGQEVVQIDVFDKDHVKDDFIGSAIIDIACVSYGQRHEQWYTLNSTPARKTRFDSLNPRPEFGEIRVGLCYDTFKTNEDASIKMSEYVAIANDERARLRSL